MYYIICPTCGDLLGTKYVPYSTDLIILCKQHKIDINYLSLYLKEDHTFRDDSAKILNKYFRNICCRQYAMNAINVADLIQ
jgi:DNA-directed RNA polymerase subunit N (RpoN/RPB10)